MRTPTAPKHIPSTYGNAKLAYKLGRSVGLGVPPARVAENRYLFRQELVAIRIRYWKDYDLGLIDGREESKAHG